MHRGVARLEVLRGPLSHLPPGGFARLDTPCVRDGHPDTYSFTFLGTVEGLNNTAYIDLDLLSFGATYCYRVVTEWPGSGESIASNEVCATIRKDVPVITRASVEATDEATVRCICAGRRPQMPTRWFSQGHTGIRCGGC